MKISLILSISLCVISSLADAAIHNGKVVDGKTYICSGIFHRYWSGIDGHGAIKFKGQCKFSGATVHIETPTVFGSSFSATLYNIEIGSNFGAYRRQLRYPNGDSYKWNINIDFNSQPNNFTFRN